MATIQANNPNAIVIDASILVSIAAKEVDTHLIAETVLNNYANNGW